MAKTEHRPAELHTFGGQPPTAGEVPTPAGAAKMQAWHIDVKSGKRMRMPYPVPVNAEDKRTAHVRHACPKKVSLNGGGSKDCDTVAWLSPQDRLPFCPQHGKELEQPDQPLHALVVARETARMFQRQAAPWLLPAAGIAADVSAAAADLGLAAAVSAPAFAAGAYVMTRRTLTVRAVRRGRVERGQRQGRRIRQIAKRSTRVAATTGESGLWFTAMSVTDVSTWAGRIVWAAAMTRWAIGCKMWWDGAERRRLRDLVVPPLVVVPQTEALPPDPVQVRAESTWVSLIGQQGGPLSGTKLVEFRRLPACDAGDAGRRKLPNWTAKVVALVPGSINMQELRPSLLGRIAAAYGCTYGDVSFAADDSDLSTAWIRVQPDNLLAEMRMWPGPQTANQWRSGVSWVGRFDDGQRMPYRWWTETGAVHDLISGCTGSGKSEFVAQLLLDGLHSDGLVLDWVGDPQGGQSYGHLKDVVDWFARDKTEITFTLLAALKEMLRRNDELSRSNTKTWRVSKAMPLLVITLDEVQSYIEDPVILNLVEKLVGQGRKCGIKMRLITQVPAAYNLGGSTYIKEQLKAGQSFICRAATDVAGRLAVDGDCPIDPTMLPAKWGAGTCAAGKSTAGLMFVQGITGRDVYGRADFTGDNMSPHLFDADGNPTATPGVFGPEAAAESGVLWGDRRDRALRLLAAGRSDEDLLPNGKALELIEAAAVSAVPAGSGGQPAAPAMQPVRVRDAVFQAATASADEHGVVTRKQVVAAADVPEKAVDRALGDLIEDGLLHRVRHGLYAVSELQRAPR